MGNQAGEIVRLTRREIRERKRRENILLQDYAKIHDNAEVKRHLFAMRYPSGRWSHGGANRSANLKREIKQKTTRIKLCFVCGGVSPEILNLTSLFPLCLCK